MKKVSHFIQWIIIISFTSSSYAIAPETDELIELQQNFYGRSSENFAKDNPNKILELPKGTKGIIKKTQSFDSGNTGLCLQILNLQNVPINTDECVWVHYNKKNPAIDLYKINAQYILKNQATGQDVTLDEFNKNELTAKLIKDPAQANAVKTNRKVAAIIEKQDPPHYGKIKKAAKKMDSEPSAQSDDQETSQAIAKQTVNSIDQFNRKPSAAAKESTYSVQCADCNKNKIYGAEQCNSKNNYLQEKLAAVTQDPLFNQSTPKNKYVKDSCIKASLATYSKDPSFFRSCKSSNSAPAYAAKPCLSNDYLEVVTKSFDMVTSCLADYYSESEDPSVNQEASLSMFKLMSWESGLNINAMSKSFTKGGRSSPVGAGGPGQFTESGIAGVNQYELKNIRKHLEKSNDLSCKFLLDKIKTPMKADAASACNRISTDDGNPFKNMVYTLGYQKKTRNFVSREFFEEEPFKNIFQLSTEEKNKLINNLTSWSHNTGEGGLSKPLRELLISYARRSKKVSSANDSAQVLSDLAVLLKKRSDRPRETSNYFNSIQSHYEPIKQASGGSCKTK